ncbi:hypothetical protein DSM104299_02893 [Baekduia alba]|uniref:hypothetical protein n=1 Tax=Baekduia alba TaxID=2997333 RepID=UPI0023403718|nr:hypothetical protein [Baekduia alba]WCB94164.1 hypothetical protein DSM104299_02893 [Baekduia alba]
MGFLKDIRNLQQQAEAMTPPAHRVVTGRVASATITAIRDTGLTTDDDTTVELDLSVTCDGDAPYAVTHRQTISRIAIASFQPGATIPVRVDLWDRSSLTIG